MLRQFLAFLLSLSLFPAAPTKLDKDQRALHAASRLTFGPTPTDLAAIHKLGVDKWIEQQLHPETISENPALLERLKTFETLQLSNKDLIAQYPRKAGKGAKNVQTVYRELAEAKLLRAVHSTHQLEELMADFWYNHFNVFFDKGADRLLVTSYERDAIRPHVLGNFKDLLLATAKHPAMLFYLDNWTSVSAENLDNLRERFQRKKAAAKKKRAAGLNENYARELLELHTMGVDNGYTQTDVTEVARCFTGWTIDGLRDDPKFLFRPLMHDRKAKTVLGQAVLPGRGEEDGMQVIDMLVRHPATAKFISTKLAQRFVADAPPPALITKMAATFTKTEGNIREVMRTMLKSPEFWAPSTYNAKMKMPFEMVASALRATNATVNNSAALQQELRAQGQPLYRKGEPTGYSPMAEEWTNSAALLSRMNFGLALTQNKVRGTRIDLAQTLNNKVKPTEIAQALLLRAPAPETLKAIESKSETNPAQIAGLVLGSPEFQRR
jgi:uncharacterized protein (DUF1800 family)